MFLHATSAVRSGWRRLGQALVATSVALVMAAGVGARETPDRPARDAASSTVALAALPAEAQTTYRLVFSGGPFPYEKDGTVFGNRERQLPSKARGWYREYTVKTPGARNRGAKRLVCGGKPPTNPETCYYTDDHYASFRKIAP